jgi:DNA-binding transcriptional LysR family regulator
MIDRIDTWRLLAAIVDLGSFAAAARRAGRSPQAVTRAIAGLERQVGVRLLHRTTRAVSLTDEGVRYLARCRRVLADVDELDAALAGVRDRPRGTLAVTAPVLFGELHVVPLVVDYLRRHRDVDVRLVLRDRIVSLADEGLDVAVRIGAMPDSALRARRVGAVRLVTCASPRYLAARGIPRAPRDLAAHDAIVFSGTTAAPDRWRYGTQSVPLRARLAVDTSRAAIEAALAGLGVVRLLSYQVGALLARGRLRLLLEEHEPAPRPVQLVTLPGATVAARVGAFVALAAARLPAQLGAPR